MRATPLRLQHRDQREQILGIGCRKRRCRLVEREHLQVAAQRAKDFDHLTMRRRQLLGERRRAQRSAEAERRHQVLGVVVESAPVDQMARSVAEARRGTGSPPRSFRQRCRAPGRRRVSRDAATRWARQSDALPLQPDLTAIGLVSPGHHLEERRLAGSVLCPSRPGFRRDGRRWKRHPRRERSGSVFVILTNSSCGTGVVIVASHGREAAAGTRNGLRRLAVARYRVVVPGDQLSVDDRPRRDRLALGDVSFKLPDRRRAMHLEST